MTEDQTPLRDSSNEPEPSSNSASQLAEQYAEFQSFNLAQWINWLNPFLSNDLRSPYILLNKEEPFHSLIDLYKGLRSKTKRDLFAEAIKLIFETTQRIEENKEQLYYLLHLISYTVPLSAKGLVRQRLHEGILSTMEYGKQNLQTLLLIANSKYDVDDDLVDYIHRSARLSNDYRHLLVCLRVLSMRGGADAFPFIEYLLPFIESKAKSFQLARQLRSIGHRVGYRHFFDWYINRSQKLASEWPEQWFLFERGLKDRLLTEQSVPILSEADPYVGFLAGLVHASLDELSPLTVLTIARLYRIIGKESAIARLYQIWKRGYDKWGREAWIYLPQETIRQPNMAAIINDRSSSEYREELFDSSIQDELEEVFLEVLDRCDSIIVRKSVAMRAGM